MQFLVYFQMNYVLLLYLKLARVDVGNLSKQVENMEGIITWSIFASWFLTELCLYMWVFEPGSLRVLYTS